MPPATKPDIPLVHFQPWIGSKYQSGNRFGKRVLVLGESHYEPDLNLDGPGYTRYVVQRHVYQERTARFFTMVPNVLMQMGAGQHLSDEDRGAVWQEIAFYNYVQELVGNAARQRPTRDMWRAAELPFLNVLQALEPDLVLVLGRALKNHVPPLPAHVTRCEIHHPSSGFSYARWNPVVAAALATANASA